METIFWLVVIGVTCFAGGTFFGMKWEERILKNAGRLKDKLGDVMGKK